MTVDEPARAEFDIPHLMRQAIRIYAAHPIPLILIALVDLPLRVIVVDAGLWLPVVAVASVAIGDIVFATLTYATATARRDSTVNPLTSYRIVLAKLITLLELLVRQIGAFFLLLITLVGIPFALRLLVRWIFGIQGVVLNDLNAKDAISHSCGLAAGRFWRLAGTMFLVFALFYVASGLAAWIVWGWETSTESSIVTGVLSTLLQPLFAAFWTLLFLRLQDATAAPSPAPVSTPPAPVLR